ncbi:MAG TPA: hypothetical protein VFV08_00750 [Puia sp.]|nr:hypothetical protein [Puia sp.]
MLGIIKVLDTTKKKVDTVLWEISQLLAPNSADRFFVHIGPASKYMEGSYLYQVELAIIYNTNSKVAYIKNLLVAFTDQNAIYNDGSDNSLERVNLSLISETIKEGGVRNRQIDELVSKFKVAN